MRRARLVFLLTVVLALVPTEARGDDDWFDIRVYICTHDPGDASYWAGGDPPECQRTDGVTVGLATEAGQWIGTCTTGQDRPGTGECALTPEFPLPSIDGHIRVVVTEDVTTLPPGYLPRENPMVVPTYGEWSAAVIVNFPVNEARSVDLPASAGSGTGPTALPAVGVGTAPLPVDPRALGMVVLAVVGSVLLRATRAYQDMR